MGESKKVMAGEDKEILPRYLAGSTWNARRIAKRNKGSQTPGSKKSALTCQLGPIGGLPRKAFARSRSYKYGAAYAAYCEFGDKVNR